MPETALVLAKHFLKWAVEKFWLKAEHVGTRLNKIARRLPFLPVLTKRNKGT
jgi:hypothetical protein